MKKNISLTLAFLLICGVLAAEFALAENVEEHSLIESKNIIEDLSSDQADIASKVALDANTTAGNMSKRDFKIIGFNRITFGHGWATSASTNSGFLVNALWITQKYTKISKDDIKDIREQFKNDSEGTKNALKNLTNQSFIKRSDGRIELGVGKGHENFKLNLTSSDNTTLVFGVFSINKDSNSTREKVGTLTLNGKAYSDLNLWTGQLVLNSGIHAGTYNIGLATQSRLIGNINELRKDIKQERGEIKDDQKNLNEDRKDLQEAQKKLGFWQRFFNFRKG